MYMQINQWTIRLNAQRLLHILFTLLAVNALGGDGPGPEPLDGDFFFAGLADAECSIVHPGKCFFDLLD
jgi:hypothetical protein